MKPYIFAPNQSLKMIDVERLHITADKREIKDFLKLPSATSFYPQTIKCIWWRNFGVPLVHIFTL